MRSSRILFTRHPGPPGKRIWLDGNEVVAIHCSDCPFLCLCLWQKRCLGCSRPHKGVGGWSCPGLCARLFTWCFHQTEHLSDQELTRQIPFQCYQNGPVSDTKLFFVGALFLFLCTNEFHLVGWLCKYVRKNLGFHISSISKSIISLKESIWRLFLNTG